MLKSKLALLYLSYHLVKSLMMLYVAWLTHNILLIILATGFLVLTISLLLNFKKVEQKIERLLNQRTLKKSHRKEARLHAKSNSMD